MLTNDFTTFFFHAKPRDANEIVELLTKTLSMNPQPTKSKQHMNKCFRCMGKPHPELFQREKKGKKNFKFQLLHLPLPLFFSPVGRIRIHILSLPKRGCYLLSLLPNQLSYSRGCHFPLLELPVHVA